MSYATKESISNILNFILQNKDISVKVPDLNGDSIQYNCVLKFIQNLDEEQKVHLNDNAEKLRNLLEDNNENKTMNKLLDYIELEIPRMSLLSELKNQTEQSRAMQRELRVQIRKKDILLDRYESKIEKLQAEFISILSIFSAILLAFFGGLSVLGSSLENINKVSGYKLIFVILIIAFTMFNVIFMLLHVVSKLTDKIIATECNNNLCKNCSDKKISLECLKGKFPIVYWYDLICIFSLTIDYILFIVDKYNVITYIFRLKSKSDVSLVGIIGLIILTFMMTAVGCKFWWDKHKRVKLKSNESIPSSI